MWEALVVSSVIVTVAATDSSCSALVCSGVLQQPVLRDHALHTGWQVPRPLPRAVASHVLPRHRQGRCAVRRGRLPDVRTAVTDARAVPGCKLYCSLWRLQQSNATQGLPRQLSQSLRDLWSRNDRKKETIPGFQSLHHHHIHDSRSVSSWPRKTKTLRPKRSWSTTLQNAVGGCVGAGCCHQHGVGRRRRCRR